MPINTHVDGNESSQNWSVFCSLPNIVSMGVTIFDPIWAQRLHTSRVIEFLHVLKGRLQLVLPGRRLEAGPGDTLFVPRGVPHRDEFDLRAGLEIFMINFRWKAEKEFFRRVDLREFQSMPLAIKAEIGMSVDRLRSDIAGGLEGDRIVAGARLLTVLTLLLRASEERRSGDRMRHLAKSRNVRRLQLMACARQYLQQHYAEPVTLEHIAGTLGVSSYYLSHVFSEESDFSLFTYLTSLRMEKARSLLGEGRRNVSEVARAVGYDDSNYFARVFRRQFGFPPGATLRAPVSRPVRQQ